MKKMALIATCLMVLVLTAGGVYAQFAKVDDAITYRKSVMVIIVQHFKQMGAMVQGKAPYDQQAFADNAAVVKVMATLPWEAFLVPGSDKGDTTLSSAVFSKTEAFKKTASAFEASTAKLEALSQNADLKAIRAQFGAVAKSCKECHKPFRK